MRDLTSSRARWLVGVAAASLLLVGAAGCGGGTVTTVTVTETATVTASAPAPTTAASSSAASTPSPSGTAGPTVVSSGLVSVSSPAAATASAAPTSAAEETVLTVRLEAFDPTTGTLTFVPQDVVDTEGSASAALSDPVGATPVTAQVTAQTNIKFARYGTDIAAAIKANDVYCNMVLEGSQVSYLWELYAT